jgi:5-methylcytosine-specific restriction endonuclease McrA
MHCLNCNNSITVGKYCSNKCQQNYQTQKIIDNWLTGKDPGYKVGFRIKDPVRKYMLEKANYQCSECGWDKINPVTGKTPLEIDHIDGDCSNCKEENLQVLCPNCHSLTETWKALNKGKGNRERHRYSGLIE